MLFASLFTSALAVLGAVSAAPAADHSGTDVKVHADVLDIVDVNADIDLAVRATSMEFESQVRGYRGAHSNREQAVKDILVGLGRDYAGHNGFIFHQFGGNFGYSIVGEALECQVQIKEGPRTEYFKVIVFKGAGTLEKYFGDGGYKNWGFRGDYVRDGDKVTFRARA